MGDPTIIHYPFCSFCVTGGLQSFVQNQPLFADPWNNRINGCILPWDPMVCNIDLDFLRRHQADHCWSPVIPSHHSMVYSGIANQDWDLQQITHKQIKPSHLIRNTTDSNKCRGSCPAFGKSAKKWWAIESTASCLNAQICPDDVFDAHA